MTTKEQVLNRLYHENETMKARGYGYNAFQTISALAEYILFRENFIPPTRQHPIKQAQPTEEGWMYLKDACFELTQESAKVLPVGMTFNPGAIRQYIDRYPQCFQNAFRKNSDQPGKHQKYSVKKYPMLNCLSVFPCQAKTQMKLFAHFASERAKRLSQPTPGPC
jgi:hypothetical protein